MVFGALLRGKRFKKVRRRRNILGIWCIRAYNVKNPPPLVEDLGQTRGDSYKGGGDPPFFSFFQFILGTPPFFDFFGFSDYKVRKLLGTLLQSSARRRRKIWWFSHRNTLENDDF